VIDDSHEQQRHVERLIYDYRRRLRFRQQQKVRLGDTADPSVDAEIEDAQYQIALLKPLTEPRPAPAVAEAIKRRVEDDYLFMYSQFTKFGARLTKVEGRQDEAAEWRVGETKARTAGQRRNLYMGLAALVVSGLSLLTALLLLLTFLRL
jgi:uncharacterized membrane protein